MRALLIIFSLAVFAFMVSCEKEQVKTNLNSTNPTFRTSSVDLYTFNGEYKLGEYDQSGDLEVTRYEDLVLYELDKYPTAIPDDSIVLQTFEFDSIYLTYQVYNAETFIRNVAISVFDENGTALKTGGDCKEHECSGDCMQWWFGYCDQCGFTYDNCCAIQGCECRSQGGWHSCCTRTVRTCECGNACEDRVINDLLNEIYE